MPTPTPRIRASDARSTAARLLRQELLHTVKCARETLGLTQAELAADIGASRATVVRAEADDADPQLLTFMAMALGCGLRPALEPTGGAEPPPLPQDLVHRGLAYNRTKHDLGYADRRRERALALAWEAANAHQDVGLQPIMPSLVPGCTQAQASACATAIQWLGSEVGFDFLVQALRQAGYTVAPSSEKRASVIR